MIKFVIDNREHKLIQALSTRTELAQPHETLPLDIGDILIASTTFERKTIADLKASVTDGRYREQKKRAMSNGIALIYIIEGDPVGYSDSDKMLTGCIVNTLVRDRIPIVFTKSLDETADFVVCLVKRVVADPGKYTIATADPSAPDASAADVSAQDASSFEYTSIICLKKKENINPESCLLLQLACIPGISAKKARDLLATHSCKTMHDLLTKLSASTVTEFAKSTPGIGKTLAATIFKYLLGPSS